MSGIYGNGVALNEKVLDYLWARQEVTLNNIANDDTPRFKSQYITFEDEMKKRLSEASASSRSPRQAVAEALEASRMRVHTTKSESTRLDGNNVDVDQEELSLVRTALEYQYILNSISNDFARLKSAARSF